MNVQYTKVFEKNALSDAFVTVNVGGARSSKSHSIMQNFMRLFLSCKNKKFGITRKTMPALRRTTYTDFIRLAQDYDVYDKFMHSKSGAYLEYNGNRLTFFGLDDPEKIKSWELHYLFMEEANEFTEDDFIVLQTRMSGKIDGEVDKMTGLPYKNQIFLSLNPSDELGWIPQNLLKQYGVKVIRSSWRDNPFLDANYIRQLLALKEQNYNKYLIYSQGEWGQKEHLVYSNFDYVDKLAGNPDEIIYGLDFGFNNPSALVKIDIKDGVCYIDEMLYETGLNNDDLISRLKALIPSYDRRRPIYADAAEPARINAIYRAGFNIKPADKSVSDGIDTVKAQRLKIVRGAANLIKEIQSYSWCTDKAGHPLDAPVKINDHALDAMRYAIRTHIGLPRPNVRATVL